MVTSKEVCDTLHVNIHALRLTQGYKPTQFEMKVSYLISVLYQDVCAECRDNLAQKRKNAENQIAGNVPAGNRNFLDKILGGK